MPFIRIKLVFSLILLSFLGTAQTSETDSLLNLLGKLKGKDKFNLLIKLSDLTIKEGDGIKYANEAISLAKKIDENTLVDAYDNLGFVYYYQEEEIKALEYFKKALEISNKNQYHKGSLNALNRIAQIYFYLDSLEQSRVYSNQLLSRAIQVDSLKYQSSALYQLGMIQKYLNNIDSSLIFMKQALEISTRINNLKDIAQTYNQLGQLYYMKADYNKSIDYYTREIQIKESVNDPQGLAIAYYNFGNTQTSIGNYQQALEQFQKALKTFEQINHTAGIANSCNGIGMVYENLSQSTLAVKENESNYNKALEYHLRALDLFKSIEDKSLEAKSLQNIGNVYSRLATNKFVADFGEEWTDSLVKLPENLILSAFSKAIDSYNQALAIFNQLNSKSDIAKANINLGSSYSYARNWPKALQFLNNGLQLARSQQMPYDIIKALYALGESYYLQKNYDQAEKLLVECAQLANEYKQKEDERYCYERLAKVYERKDMVRNAYAFYKLSVKIKDEIFSEKSQKAITEMQTKYETDKKEAENKLLKNETALQDAQIKRQQLTIIGAIIGSVLILVVALLMFRMYREKRKANRVLEEKNELISQQKQEITDSIRYASRIQRAILPSDDLLAETLPEHFVLYLPRDIVSGDFFWITSHGHKVVIVAADCTGHGVPGAFMSMLGVSFLYEIVNKEGIMQPAAILNFLRVHIKTTLSQKGKADEQKDGMDISLCVLDRHEMKLEWAGAYNPLYLIRKGELIEYKADKMPVAIHMLDHMPFTNHEIAIEKGDTFYISSDGYADQFGGTEGRKFMSKKYKELLLTIWDKPMQEQKEILNKAHLDWKGEHEQVDDILVMGVRI